MTPTLDVAMAPSRIHNKIHNSKLCLVLGLVTNILPLDSRCIGLRSTARLRWVNFLNLSRSVDLRPGFMSLSILRSSVLSRCRSSVLLVVATLRRVTRAVPLDLIHSLQLCKNHYSRAAGKRSCRHRDLDSRRAAILPGPYISALFLVLLLWNKRCGGVS
ncbi:hypothetical protein EDB83DRAFT_1301671 [Lactarius deliciosus]|nr:hypothetical protein EDB83DRAFT_1301671 [Lactarius deliciosus]